MLTPKAKPKPCTKGGAAPLISKGRSDYCYRQHMSICYRQHMSNCKNVAYELMLQAAYDHLQKCSLPSNSMRAS